MPKLEMKEGYPLGRHRNGVWYLRTSIPGIGEKVISTGKTDFKQALKAARDLERELLKQDPNYRPYLYEEIAREAFEVCQKENRATTVKEARIIYDTRLIPAFGALPIEMVTDRLWIEQVEQWKRDTPRRTKFANIRKYAVQVDNYAFRKGFKKFKCEFPIDDGESREGKVLTDDEFALALRACRHHLDPKTKAAKREKVGRDLTRGKQLEMFLVLARSMGMRRGEVLGLEWERVDLKKRSITLEAEHTKTGSKTGRGREFGIAPEAMPFLEEAALNAKSDWLFPNRAGTGPLFEMKTALRVLRKKTGLDFKPHDLRHTFLTVKLLVEKKNPMDVAIYAGVSLEVIQRVYLHPKVDDTRHVVEVPRDP